MLDRKSDRIHAALIAAMVLAGLWVMLVVPAEARVAIHFDAQGAPNGWASPVQAVFLMPAMAGLMWSLMTVLPKIDPKGDNLRRSAGAVNAIGLALTVLATCLQLVIVTGALGLPAPKPSLGLLLIGGVHMVVGNVMGKLRPNYTVGIRTPWTLANERVWDQTHRFGGKVFVLGGAVLCAMGAFSMVPGHEGPAIVAVTLLCAGAAVLKSYLFWRALPH